MRCRLLICCCFIYSFFSLLFAYTHKVDIYIEDDQSKNVKTLLMSSSNFSIYSTSFFCTTSLPIKFARFFIQISSVAKDVVFEKYSDWILITKDSCFPIKNTLEVETSIFSNNGIYQVSVTFEEHINKNESSIQKSSASINIDVEPDKVENDDDNDNVTKIFLQHPKNGSTLRGSQPFFHWSSPGDNISYVFRLFESVSYDKLVQTVLSIHGERFLYPLEAFKLQNGNQYHWQICALDPSDNEITESCSNKYKFKFIKQNIHKDVISLDEPESLFFLSGRVLNNINQQGVVSFIEVKNKKDQSIDTGISNKDGTYSLKLPSGDYQIFVSAIGHQTNTQTVSLDNSTLLDIVLNKECSDFKLLFFTPFVSKKPFKVILSGEIFYKSISISSGDAYTFSCLPSGIFDLEFPKQGGVQQYKVKIKLLSGKNLSHQIILKKEEFLELSGKIISSKKENPYSRYGLRLESVDTSILKTYTSSADSLGRFRFVKVQEGDYYFIISSSRGIHYKKKVKLRVESNRFLKIQFLDPLFKVKFHIKEKGKSINNLLHGVTISSSTSREGSSCYTKKNGLATCLMFPGKQSIQVFVPGYNEITKEIEVLDRTHPKSYYFFLEKEKKKICFEITSGDGVKYLEEVLITHDLILEPFTLENSNRCVWLKKRMYQGIKFQVSGFIPLFIDLSVSNYVNDVILITLKKEVRLSGIVKNSYNQSLSDVKIKTFTNTKSVFSDQNGKFHLSVEEHFPIVLSFKKQGFEPFYYVIENKAGLKQMKFFLKEELDHVTSFTQQRIMADLKKLQKNLVILKRWIEDEMSGLDIHLEYLILLPKLFEDELMVSCSINLETLLKSYERFRLNKNTLELHRKKIFVQNDFIKDFLIPQVLWIKEILLVKERKLTFKIKDLKHRIKKSSLLSLDIKKYLSEGLNDTIIDVLDKTMLQHKMWSKATLHKIQNAKKVTEKEKRKLTKRQLQSQKKQIDFLKLFECILNTNEELPSELVIFEESNLDIKKSKNKKRTNYILEILEVQEYIENYILEEEKSVVDLIAVLSKTSRPLRNIKEHLLKVQNFLFWLNEQVETSIERVERLQDFYLNIGNIFKSFTKIGEFKTQISESEGSISEKLSLDVLFLIDSGFLSSFLSNLKVHVPSLEVDLNSILSHNETLFRDQNHNILDFVKASYTWLISDDYQSSIQKDVFSNLNNVIQDYDHFIEGFMEINQKTGDLFDHERFLSCMRDRIDSLQSKDLDSSNLKLLELEFSKKPYQHVFLCLSDKLQSLIPHSYDEFQNPSSHLFLKELIPNAYEFFHSRDSSIGLEITNIYKFLPSSFTSFFSKDTFFEIFFSKDSNSFEISLSHWLQKTLQSNLNLIDFPISKDLSLLHDWVSNLNINQVKSDIYDRFINLLKSSIHKFTCSNLSSDIGGFELSIEDCHLGYQGHFFLEFQAKLIIPSFSLLEFLETDSKNSILNIGKVRFGSDGSASCDTLVWNGNLDASLFGFKISLTNFSFSPLDKKISLLGTIYINLDQQYSIDISDCSWIFTNGNWILDRFSISLLKPIRWGFLTISSFNFIHHLHLLEFSGNIEIPQRGSLGGIHKITLEKIQFQDGNFIHATSGPLELSFLKDVNLSIESVVCTLEDSVFIVRLTKNNLFINNRLLKKYLQGSFELDIERIIIPISSRSPSIEGVNLSLPTLSMGVFSFELQGLSFDHKGGSLKLNLDTLLNVNIIGARVSGQTSFIFSFLVPMKLKSIYFSIDKKAFSLTGILEVGSSYFFASVSTKFLSLLLEGTFYQRSLDHWFINCSISSDKIGILLASMGATELWLSGGGVRIGKREEQILIGIETSLSITSLSQVLIANGSFSISYLTGTNLLKLEGVANIFPESSFVKGFTTSGILRAELRIHHTEGYFLGFLHTSVNILDLFNLQGQLELFFSRDYFLLSLSAIGILDFSILKVRILGGVIVGISGLKPVPLRGIAYQGKTFVPPSSLIAGLATWIEIAFSLNITEVTGEHLSRILSGSLYLGGGGIILLDFSKPLLGGGFYITFSGEVRVFSLIGLSLAFSLDMGAQFYKEAQQMKAYFLGYLLLRACVFILGLDELCIEGDIKVKLGDPPKGIKEISVKDLDQVEDPRTDIQVFVEDLNGKKLSNVTVKVGTITGKTNQYGFFWSNKVTLFNKINIKVMSDKYKQKLLRVNQKEILSSSVEIESPRQQIIIIVDKTD